MGKKDTVLKECLSKPEIFADLFNGFLFEGKQVLKKEQITPIDSSTTVLVRGKQGKAQPVQRYRDVICKGAMGVQFVVLGVENQMNVHYAMPVRSMLYDALSYAEQAAEISREHKKEGTLRGDEYLSGFCKEDRLLPAITLVVYYGEKKWDAGTELYDILKLGENREWLEPYLTNYRLNLLKVNEAEGLERYQTGLRELLGILKYQKDLAQLTAYMEKNKERYQNLDEATYQAIQYLANMEEILGEPEEGGKQNMLQAFEQLKEQYINIGRAKGFEEGILKGQAKGIAEGMRGMMQIMKEYGSNKESTINKILTRYPGYKEMILRIADEVFSNS